MPEEYEIAEPRASALIEALRAVGYTVQTALADLIDNSITASAQNVWLDLRWAGRDSSIAVTDDGKGMDEAELACAMRPGNRSPLEPRSPHDLGRFGLGLKTASFSQARRLTVASKKQGRPVAVRRWDLDYVGKTGEWRLLKSAAPGSEGLLANLGQMKHGTVVLWEDLDRIVHDADVADRHAQNRFLGTAQTIHDHLAMVFHQYLSGPRPELRIFINGNEDRNRVHPWDPFLEKHIATFAVSDAETIKFPEGNVRTKGFVLPHKDRLSPDEFADAAGPLGWNGQQGFYVYRNRRLLVAGGWLDLGYTSEEQYKLARIRVEIPNSTDSDWAIDVKKSKAFPPAAIKTRLRELADAVRARAREIYVHRGHRSAGPPDEPLRHLWIPVTKDGRLAYKIDRMHPLARLVFSQAPKEAKQAIEALLRLLEATVPIQQIWLDAAEKPELHAAPFESDPPSHVRHVLQQFYLALVADSIEPEVALSRIASLEPFKAFPDLVGELAETIEEG